ncbi:hypothetical protein OIO90_003346 [Microbotryomycetes sp. JL221]|nr:hypothetical protein OIO90_003346 [Microbotryomycetes sp. JL221]
MTSQITPIRGLPSYEDVVEQGLEAPPTYPVPNTSNKPSYVSPAHMFQVALFGSIMFSKPRFLKRRRKSSASSSSSSLSVESDAMYTLYTDPYLPTYEAAVLPSLQPEQDVGPVSELWHRLPRGDEDGRGRMWGAAMGGRHTYAYM